MSAAPDVSWFDAAYRTDPAWAAANLTTWLVIVGIVAACANVAVVIAAFEVQRRQFQRDRREREAERNELHLAALVAVQGALEIYDVAIGGKGNLRTTFRRTDVIGRLEVFQRYAEYYLNKDIVAGSIVSTLMTVLSLFDRTIADLNALTPLDTDDLPATELDRMYNFRRKLRDGAVALYQNSLKSMSANPDSV